MAITEADICDAIISKITTLVPEVNSISFDRIRLNMDDFREHELPAVQLIGEGQSITHRRSQKEVSWAIQLELVMKSTTAGEVDQRALLELREKIVLALWDKPNLGLPDMFHLVYTGNGTDLHMLVPYYIATVNFSAVFVNDLTGTC